MSITSKGMMGHLPKALPAVNPSGYRPAGATLAAWLNGLPELAPILWPSPTENGEEPLLLIPQTRWLITFAADSSQLAIWTRARVIGLRRETHPA